MARVRESSKFSFTFDGPAQEGSYTKIRTPDDAAGACGIATLPQEAFVVLALNAKNNLINRRLVTLGLLDSSLIHPREVFRGAIRDGAAAIVVVHNHPSGDTTPSAEDVRITRQLIDAGKIIDIRVLDHVIVAQEKRLSLRENGLADFTS